MRKLRKRIFRLIGLIFILIISLVSVELFVYNPGSGKPSKSDYSNWMAENVRGDKRIVDVAMLGAHDAFSYSINHKSPLDDRSHDNTMEGLLGTVAKNMFVRISKTQTEPIDKLLKGGVRYLDIRLSYDADYQGGGWFITHNYLGDKFESFLPDIDSFLRNNVGEVLIFDFQHIYDDRSNEGKSEKIISELTTLLSNSGLLEYAYSFDAKSLSEVTYDDLTNNKTKSAIVMITKHQTSDRRFLVYENSIRSNWFNSADDGFVLESIENESNFIESDVELKNKFRVMQAVITLNSLPAIIKRWSIISAAKVFNNKLAENDNFDEFLLNLPIVMVDCSVTSSNDFLDNAMEKIVSLNI